MSVVRSGRGELMSFSRLVSSTPVSQRWLQVLCIDLIIPTRPAPGCFVGSCDTAFSSHVRDDPFSTPDTAPLHPSLRSWPRPTIDLRRRVGRVRPPRPVPLAGRPVRPGPIVRLGARAAFPASPGRPPASLVAAVVSPRVPVPTRQNRRRNSVPVPLTASGAPSVGSPLRSLRTRFLRRRLELPRSTLLRCI